LGKRQVITHSFTPVVHALVVATLLLATATVMLVTVNASRAANALAIGVYGAFGKRYDFVEVEDARNSVALAGW
jgi:hypothetical protein